MSKHAFSGVVAFVIVIGLSCTNDGLPIISPLPFNFQVAEDGRVYRSAQPSADQLALTADWFGIRTVLNLRGENPEEPWYVDEERVCREKGLTLVNIPLSMSRLPTAEQLRTVVQTLQTAEYPMLIHCQGGADRTGMVSAIYAMLILGQERGEALKQLSPEYLHYRFRAPCMDVLAELYEPTDAWLEWYEEQFEQLTCH